MNRRQFMKTGVAAATAAATGFNAEAQTTKPPNILYIFADQHRAQSVQGAGGAQADILTPHLNAFRSNGFNMSNCYSNYPLCSPHRAMLQTGIWPQKNGVTGNEIVGGTTQQQANIAALNTSNTTIGQILQQNANYYTGYVGKWDLYNDPNGKYLDANNLNRFNYNEWMAWFNCNQHWVGGPDATPNDGTTVTKTNSAYYYDPATGDRAFVFPYTGASPNAAKGTWNPHYQTLQAQDFIQRNKTNNQPWLLFVSYNVPHPPYNPPDGTAPGITPSNGYPYYDETQIPALRPNNDTVASGGIPDTTLHQDRSANDPASDSDPTQNGAGYLQGPHAINQTTWNYYEGISDIDTEIQTLMNSVGDDPNTIIIYSSDHGDMLGSHTLAGKQFPFEESTSVPFYVGGQINGNAISGSYAGLFSTIDIVPTLCGLAGVIPPSCLDGKNFASVIKGNATDIPNPNQYIFLLNGHGDPANANGDNQFSGYYACPVYRGIRSARYTYACVATNNLKYFRMTGTAHRDVGPYLEGHWLLFDNQQDQFQQNNLIGSDGSYPASTGSQPVPSFSDFRTALESFITANSNSTNGPDPFVSSVLT